MRNPIANLLPFFKKKVVPNKKKILKDKIQKKELQDAKHKATD